MCAIAPGKVILVGEHFVVGGQPAIAAAVEIEARVKAEFIDKEGVNVSSMEYGEAFFSFEDEKNGPLYPVYVAAKEVLKITDKTKGLNLKIESSIPRAAGMGSSAAVAVATVAATAKLLGLELSLEKISEIAYRSETVVHGKPSGIDNTVSTYGGLIFYKKGMRFRQLSSNISSIRLVLADSGIERSTGAMVAKVLTLRDRYPHVLEHIYNAAGELAYSAKDALEQGDFFRVGQLMNINHGLLHAIGVSNNKLDLLVDAAREAGALGAKLTGAGGGGFVVALCWKEDAGRVADTLKSMAKQVLVTGISRWGVRLTEPSPSFR
ncbi:MAG: mevalonate kinase [Thermofilaceae archaeon]